MSVVIAVKDEQFGRYILGADTQISFGEDYKADMGDGESKIMTYQIGNYPKVILGGVGRYKPLQVLSFTQLISADDFVSNPDGFSMEWVFTILVPRIQSIFIPLGLMVKNPENEAELCFPNTFLFACQDKCYYICGDGCVHTVDDAWAIGSGGPTAFGAIKNFDENPLKKVVRAITSTSQLHVSVNDTIDIEVTKEIGKEKQYFDAFDFEGVEKYWAEYKKQEEEQLNAETALLNLVRKSQAQFSAYKEIVKSIVDEETFSKISAAYDGIDDVCEGSTDAKGED